MTAAGPGITFRFTSGCAAVVAVCCTMFIHACDRGEPHADDPMAHVRALADDGMEGRGLGQPGLARALDYAESVMAAAGLEPVFTDSAAGPTYRQEVPVVRYVMGDGNRAVLTVAGERRELSHGAQMLVFRPGRPTDVAGGLVYLGYGIHEPELGRDDYAGVEARGRWAVLLEGRPDEMSAELAALYHNVDESGDRILAAATGAGVLGLVVVLSAEAYAAWDVIAGASAGAVHAAARHYLGGAQADADFPVIVLAALQIQALFAGTGCDPIAGTGVDRSFEVPNAYLSLTTDAERTVITSHNLAGLIRGREAPAEIVALTAHIDHLGVRDGQIYNGANDDASGCAAVLSSAYRLRGTDLSRSVLCVLFTGEETGHFGSMHFLSEPPVGTLVAAVNLEHVGRSQDGTFLTTASADLLPDIETVAAASEGMRTAALDSEGMIIRGSDSYSFFLHGLPTAIMGGGGFPEYHQPEDDIDLIDADLLDRAVDLSVAMCTRLAGKKVP